MATYKKHGGKPSSNKEKQKNISKDSTTAEVFNTLDETASKTEKFFSKYQSIIIGFILVAIVGVLGFIGYEKFIVEPKQNEATNELSQSQTFFDMALESAQTQERDSLFNLAINGAQGKFGFVDVAKEYSSTKSGNLANYYAGISYLNIGKYDLAIEYLDKFKADDEMISAFALGAMGDAFSKLEQFDNALEYYEKAAKHRDNDYTTPKYLFKAALTAMAMQDAEKAIKHLNTIEEKYPDSEQAESLKPYLGKAMAMKP